MFQYHQHLRLWQLVAHWNTSGQVTSSTHAAYENTRRAPCMFALGLKTREQFVDYMKPAGDKWAVTRNQRHLYVCYKQFRSKFQQKSGTDIMFNWGKSCCAKQTTKGHAKFALQAKRSTVPVRRIQMWMSENNGWHISVNSFHVQSLHVSAKWLNVWSDVIWRNRVKRLQLKLSLCTIPHEGVQRDLGYSFIFRKLGTMRSTLCWAVPLKQFADIQAYSYWLLSLFWCGNSLLKLVQAF
jgi:hypothetical protein